ncbi:MAG: hypothetical protein ACK5MN_13920 [Lachnospiraceae bacterium]
MSFVTKDLCFTYESTQILDHISLDTRKGEFVGIIGPMEAAKARCSNVCTAYSNRTAERFS